MSCSDENRLSPTPPQTNEEKRSGAIMSVRRVGWDVSDRMDLGFMVREIWVSISALYLTLLTFCCLIGKVETRV